MDTNYGFGKTVNYSFNETVEKVTEELSKQGFGILTQIDVAATLKKKLDKDMPPYLILGACNPNLAHQALMAEESIGLLLPCNVVVREASNGEVHVEILNPDTMTQLVDKKEIDPIAKDAKQRLETALDSL